MAERRHPQPGRRPGGAADRQLDELIEVRLRAGEWPLVTVGDDEVELAGLVEGLLSLRPEEWPGADPATAGPMAAARRLDTLIDVRLHTGEWPLTAVDEDEVELAGLVDAVLSLTAVEWPDEAVADPEVAAARAVDDIIELRLRIGEWPLVVEPFDSAGELSGVVEALMALAPEEWPAAGPARPGRLDDPVPVSPVPPGRWPALAGSPRLGPTRLRPGRRRAKSPTVVVRVPREAGSPAQRRMLAAAAVLVLLVGVLSAVSLATGPGRAPSTGAQAVHARMVLLDDRVQLSLLTSPVAPGRSSAPAGVSGVDCMTAMSCVAVGTGPAGAVTATTSDGGISWMVSPAPSGVTQLAAVACPSTLRCWAVGSRRSGAAIVATADGGRTWAPQSPPAGTGSLSSLSCVSDMSCVAVGMAEGGPAVVASGDERTWHASNAPVARTLNSVACITGGACVLGTTGTTGSPVAATGDGGGTWAPQPLGAPAVGPDRAAAITSVTGTACPAPDACFALGFDAAGGVWALSSTGPGSGWTSPYPQPVAAPATGQRVAWTEQCVTATDCPANPALTANPALAVIAGSTGLGLVGAPVAFVCRGPGVPCWSVQVTGSGFEAVTAGSPALVSSGTT
jgi:hypothetical protein